MKIMKLHSKAKRNSVFIMATTKVTKEMDKKAVLIFSDRLEQLMRLNPTEALKKFRSIKEQ